MQGIVLRILKLPYGIVLVLIFLAGCAAACNSSGSGATSNQIENGNISILVQPTAEFEFGQDGDPARNPAQNTAMSTFFSDDFIGAGVCLMCHANLVDQSGTDVSITTDWRSTMMANASRDPFWQAKVSSEIERSPDLQPVIEEKCATCHQPMAKAQAEVAGSEVAIFEDGFDDVNHPLYLVGLDGVSCSLCHQIQAGNLGTEESFTGGFEIDTSTEPPMRVMFGPFEQPFTMPMQNHTGFLPEFGEQTNQAELCATCHLFTPYVDAEDTVQGDFPEQTPYLEWENSDYGDQSITCQSCHMPKADGGVSISLMPGNLSPREPFFKHFFVGGNTFVLQMLSDWGADLNAGADQSHFDTTIARTEEQISQRTAQMEIQVLEVKDGKLTAELQIIPLTGHKFPSGFPSRRAWLHVTILDAAGKIVFESGKLNPDGSISGNAADLDPSRYEPHYDLVTSPDQVQIYEPVMINSDGEVTYTLMRAAGYVKDNRLLPKGTDKVDLPEEIAAQGAAAKDPDFVGGGDTITYQIDLADMQGPFTFSAELLYQSLSFQFVQDMLTDSTNPIDQFSGYYGEMPKTPLLVAVIPPVEVKE